MLYEDVTGRGWFFLTYPFTSFSESYKTSRINLLIIDLMFKARKPYLSVYLFI